MTLLKIGDREVPLDVVTIKIRIPCTTCAGTGGAPTEEWEAFDEWVREQGLYGRRERDRAVEDYFLDVMSLDAVPPERHDCPVCEAGRVDAEVGADVLLAVFLQAVEGPVLTDEQLDPIVESVKRSMATAASKSTGLPDGGDVGSWLRAVQEGAEALRCLGELRPRVRDL